MTGWRQRPVTRLPPASLELKFIQVIGNQDLGADHPFQLCLERLLGFQFPMDQEDLLGRIPDVTHPLEYLTGIRMGGKSIQTCDPGPHGHSTTVDFHLLHPFYNKPSQGSVRLISHEEYRVARIGETILEMMQDSPPGKISAGGNNHTRVLHLIEGFGFLNASHQTDIA